MSWALSCPLREMIWARYCGRLSRALTEVRQVAIALQNKANGLMLLERLAEEILAAWIRESGRTRTDCAGQCRGSRSATQREGLPLLPARYHIAATTIEGALSSSRQMRQKDGAGCSQGKQARFRPTRRLRPFRCSSAGACGEPYVEAWDDNVRLAGLPPRNGNGERTVLRLWSATAAATLDEEQDEDEHIELVHFDPSTGEIEDDPGDGILSLQEAECVADDHDRKKYVKACLACGEKKGAFAEPSDNHLRR